MSAVWEWTEAFRFIRPWWIVAIPLIGVIWWLVRNRTGASKPAMAGHIASHLLDALTVNGVRGRRFGPSDSVAIIGILAAMAAAGPAWSRIPNPFLTETSPLVIALEVSGTMLANDVQPSRLVRAKLKVLDIIESRPGARTALVAYAGTAHSVLPLTDDPRIVKPFLEALTPEIMPETGQNAGAALALAQALLDLEASPGSVLFVNDGVDSADIPAFSAHEGAPVVALVFGTEQGGVARSADGEFAKGSGGELLETGVDEDVLTRWGRQGGAKIIRAGSGDADVAAVARQVRSNLQSALDADERAQWEDRGVWLVWPAALLTLLWFRRGWTMQWVWVLGAAGMLASAPGELRAEGLADWFFTPDQQGRYAYEHKQFPEAAEWFEDPSWKGVALYRAGRYLEAAETFARLPTADGLFNAGNAYVKGREYEKGVAAFEAALAVDAGHASAKQNLEVTRAIIEYLTQTRLAEDTGEQTELGADDYKFDRKGDEGTEMIITGQGKLSLESAEQWMRAVDTRTSDFLRTKFALEAAQGVGQ